MRVFMMAVAGLMVAVGAQAQQSTQAQEKAQAEQKAQARWDAWVQQRLLAAEIALDYGACPGALRVQHQPVGPTMWTVAQEDKDRDNQAQRVKGPGLHVEFEGVLDGVREKVKTLEFSVSYVPAAWRLMPVEPGTDAKSPKESKKTFVLQQEAAQRFDADLLVGPAATITRVHLVSATFADGNVWHAASEDDCSIAPSLYMPVEAKR